MYPAPKTFTQQIPSFASGQQSLVISLTSLAGQSQLQALWNTALERAVAAHSQVDGEVNNENVGADRYLVSKDNFGNDVVIMVDNILKGVKNSAHQVIANEIAKNIGKYYYIIESGQKVYIGKDLPSEYTQSIYTKRLNKTCEKSICTEFRRND